MRAIIASNEGLPLWEQHEQPEMAADEVRIKVAYSGMNRADLAQIGGVYPPPPGVTDVLGLEVSGTVIDVGAAVTNLAVGDEVCALLSGGGYAEQVVAPANQVLPIPQAMTLAEAAGICEVFATAWFNIYDIAAAQPHERILIHAGASAVGQAVLQLAKHFNNPTFVTVGSDDKLELCLQEGAEKGWNRYQGNFVEAVKEWGGADIILDPVGGDYFAWNQEVLNLDGRLIAIGLLGGRAASIDFGRLLMKRQRVIGSTLRSQPNAIKAKLMQALHEQLWPLFASNRLRANIDTVIPIENVEQALARMARNETQGKLILAW